MAASPPFLESSFYSLWTEPNGSSLLLLRVFLMNSIQFKKRDKYISGRMWRNCHLTKSRIKFVKEIRLFFQKKNQKNKKPTEFLSTVHDYGRKVETRGN